MGIYEGIVQGLNEAVTHNEGKIKARTKTMLIRSSAEYEATEIKCISDEYGAKLKAIEEQELE